MIAISAIIIFGVPMFAMFALGNLYGSQGSPVHLIAASLLAALYVALAVYWGNDGEKSITK